MKSHRLLSLAAVLAPVFSAATLLAWDAPGHRIVNRFALSSLPPDFPDFVRAPAAVERIAFLAGEPDRWSHASDLSLKHYNWPDHYLDIEQLPDAGLDPATLPSFRYEFVAAFAAARVAHADKFPPIDPAKDPDRTRRWPGFLPWTVTESFGKLKTAFSSLKVYRELGTPAEITNAEEDVIYLMGTMGHYVGDMTEPLHTTVQHDGWTGPNPRGYYTGKGFHTWIDSGLIAKAGIRIEDVAPRMTAAQPLSLAPRPDGRDPVFVAMVDFIVEQNKLVEPLYQLDLDHKLGRGDIAVAPEGRALIEQQLAKGGELLGGLWLTAWRSAPPDTYLRSVLIKRQLEKTPAAAPVSK
ncbi:MAG: hypothetical protein JWM88_1481 [Verrucomicrobia bacterium]|nr:hypothetical protein [Verrucomicrobiota bacterium]